MSKRRECIDPELAAWMTQQRVFFVATAPRDEAGHINLSPKGGDSFRVLAPMEVVYQDYTGSGAETAAHLRENGRIIIMFCAFDGPPQVARLHGRGTLVTASDPRFAEFAGQFPPNAGTRAFIHVRVSRVSTSCGYSVPFFDYRAPRDTLERWVAKQTPESLAIYRATKNKASIDGLPAFPETPRST